MRLVAVEKKKSFLYSLFPYRVTLFVTIMISDDASKKKVLFHLFLNRSLQETDIISSIIFYRKQKVS